MYTTKEWIASDLPTPVPKFITGGTAHCEPNNDQQPAKIATVFASVFVFLFLIISLGSERIRSSLPEA